MTKTKATAAETEERIKQVYQLLVSGVSRARVLQYAAENWSLATRTTDALIAKAKQRVIADAKPEREFELARAITRLNDIYSACRRESDYGRAIAAQRELNQLLGLYAEPAAQTLKVIGVDSAQLVEVAEALEKNGLKASDVFAAMLKRLAMREQTL